MFPDQQPNGPRMDAQITDREGSGVTSMNIFAKYFGKISTWDQYRKSRRLMWVVGICLIPFVLVLAATLDELLHLPSVAWVIMGAWLAWWYIQSLRLMFFRCPNCGKLFFWSWKG